MDWHLEDVGKIVKTTKVCCGARRVKVEAERNHHTNIQTGSERHDHKWNIFKNVEENRAEQTTPLQRSKFNKTIIFEDSSKQFAIERQKRAPQLLKNCAEEIARTFNLSISKSASVQSNYKAEFQKGYKRYLATRTHGENTILKDCGGDVSLQVAKGINAVVMQHTWTDFEIIRKVISLKECLVAPVNHFHIQELFHQEVPGTYKYKAIIPHCLSNNDHLSSVRVRFGDLSQSEQMKDIRKGRLEGHEKFPYFEINRRVVTIFCDHFCDVICTTEQKVCTSKVLAMPFGRIFQVPYDDKVQTNVKVKTYLCSILYRGERLKGELKAEAGEFNLKLLEQLTIPINVDDVSIEDSEVEVSLATEDSWKPSKRKINGDTPKLPMVERSKLPGIFTISDGHLCRSEPFDAANFGLKYDGIKPLFVGNVGVTFHTPGKIDQHRDVDITIELDSSQGAFGASGPSSKSADQLSSEQDSNKQLEFTDGRLVLLSKEITTTGQLRILASFGLKVDLAVIDTALHNNRDEITEAAYTVLTKWRDSQSNKHTAYTQMCKALRRVKMHLLITKMDEDNYE